jgi:uncharacterized lipoprotein YehR (DUF1307 family)
MKYTILILLFCFGCAEHKSSTQTYLKNSTGHKIEVCPFLNGIPTNTDYKLVLPFENLKVLDMHVNGKTLSPNFGSLLRTYDSVVIKFDDSIAITHLRFNVTSVSYKAILESSGRSISNPNNYIQTISKDSKNALTGYFTFEFTEDDYLFAKN